jgi:hypothetical protein
MQMASCARLDGEVMSEAVQVREWDVDTFHRKVLQLESQGFVARRETYRIVADVNPETGVVVHLHIMELHRPE